MQVLPPLWKRLPKASTRVYRLQTNAGERIIGRVVSPTWVATTLTANTPQLSPENAIAVGRTTLELDENLQLRQARVMGIDRIELTDRQIA